MNDTLKIWNELGDKILSCILTDHGAYYPVVDVLTPDVTLWSPQVRAVWKAITQCVEADTLPTTEAVKLRLNGNTPTEYLNKLTRQWNDEDNAKVVYHAEQMKQVGLLAKLRSVGRKLADIDNVAGLDEAIDQADLDLGAIAAFNTDRKGDAESVLNSAWAEVESFQGEGIPTGLKWFDRLTGGIWPGFNYWINAAYKSGKSSLMRNIALNVAQDAHPIDIYCAEGSREMFVLDCVAMLASGLMLDRGVFTNQLRLSGLFIKRAWRNQTLFSQDEYQCINEARQIWQKLPIRVWDSRDGIRDRATLKHIIKKSKLEYRSLVHMFDYSQLIGNEPTIYERQSNTSLMVQDICVTEGIAFWMLAQLNEAAVKGGTGHSSGVKGGGDADAAADFALIPKIDETGLTIKLKHSRHTAAGAKETHTTTPASGLIIDKWLEK
jgi:replicative DNA helicase